MIKGLVFDIRRFTVHDGPGIRTTVFFKGCPLRCWWCHNPESQEVKSEESVRRLMLAGSSFHRTETTGAFMTVDAVMEEVLRDRMFYEESGGGITLSGGEPLMQESFACELLRAAHREGLHTCLDTSGYARPESIRHIAAWTDLFLYDIKLVDDALHRKYTGVSNTIILENLRFLVATGKQVVLRLPVVPGITDTRENIDGIKSLITGFSPLTTHDSRLTLHLLPYHTTAKEKYRRFCKTNPLEGLAPLPVKSLMPLAGEFESMGLRVILGG